MNKNVCTAVVGFASPYPTFDALPVQTLREIRAPVNDPPSHRRRRNHRLAFTAALSGILARRALSPEEVSLSSRVCPWRRRSTQPFADNLSNRTSLAATLSFARGSHLSVRRRCKTCRWPACGRAVVMFFRPSRVREVRITKSAGNKSWPMSERRGPYSLASRYSFLYPRVRSSIGPRFFYRSATSIRVPSTSGGTQESCDEEPLVAVATGPERTDDLHPSAAIGRMQRDSRRRIDRGRVATGIAGTI